MDIGKIIKDKRTENNLTQEELAQKFFVTRQLISKWENGKSYPDLQQVVKLSELFDISLDALLRGDEMIVKELNFDTKRKKISKLVIILLSIILIGITSVFSVFWLIEPIFIQSKDITITKITKTILPEKQVTLENTGETITLPEDVEYTVYFSTNKALVKMPKVSGYKTFADKDSIELQISGYRSLFGGNKDSKIFVRSDRESNVLDPQSNIGKSLYLYNIEKTRALFENPEYSFAEHEVALGGDKIADVSELEKAPIEK